MKNLLDDILSVIKIILWINIAHNLLISETTQLTQAIINGAFIASISALKAHVFNPDRSTYGDSIMYLFRLTLVALVSPFGTNENTEDNNESNHSRDAIQIGSRLDISKPNRLDGSFN